MELWRVKTKRPKRTNLKSVPERDSERNIGGGSERHRSGTSEGDRSDIGVTGFRYTERGKNNTNPLELGEFGSIMRSHRPRRPYGQNHAMPPPRKLHLKIKDSVRFTKEWNEDVLNLDGGIRKKFPCPECGVYHTPFPKTDDSPDHRPLAYADYLQQCSVAKSVPQKSTSCENSNF